MARFTWTVPSASEPPDPGPPASTSTSEPEGLLFGGFDQEIDPVTRDYVDTSDGAWAETASSRTAVMLQLEIRYNAWPADPNAGSRLAEMLESGDPIGPDMVVDEVKRSMQLLVDDGIITDLSVEIGAYEPEAGALQIDMTYTDVASGHTVELAYSPLVD